MEDGDSGVLTLVKQGSITFIGNVASKLLGFLFIMAVTRLVTPSVYGFFTLGVAIVTFGQGVFSLNLSRAVDYFLPKQLAASDYDQAKSTFVTVVVFGTLFTGLGYILLVAAAAPLSNQFDEPALKTLLPIIGLAIPLLNLEQTLLATYNSVKQLKYRVYTKDFVNPVTKLVGAVTLVLLGAEIWGLVVAYLLAISLSIITGAYLLYRSQTWLRRGKLQRVDITKLAVYSVPLMFAGVIYATVGQVDYFVIGYFMTSADVGVYRVGYVLAANLLIVLGAVTPVFKPMIAERSDEPEKLRAQYRLATRWVTMATVPIAIAMIGAPETYLALLFTDEYAAASTVLIVLVVGFLVNASFGPEGMMLEGLGYTRLTLLNTVVLIVTNGVLDIYLVPRLGIVGAAIGTAAGFSVAGSIGVLEVWILEDTHPYSWNVAKLWVAGVPLLWLARFASGFYEPGLLVAIGTPVVAVTSYVATLVLVNAFTEDDERVARKIDERLGLGLSEPIVAMGKS